MMFRSDSQRKAMFAAINGVNRFSQKNVDNNFALKVVKDKNGLRVRSDEYPEVDVELDQGKTGLRQIEWDLSGVADQDLIGLDKIQYVKYKDDPGVSSYNYDDKDKLFIKMRDRDGGLSLRSGPSYRHQSFKHEVGHHVDRDAILGGNYKDRKIGYIVAEVVADETVRQREPDYHSQADMFLKLPNLEEYAIEAAEENVGLDDIKALTFEEAEEYAK